MLKFILLLIPIILLSSCEIDQDYHFKENGEVDMNINVDMSGFYKSMPPGTDKKGMGNIKDSINSNIDIQDSLKQYGITKFEMDFDTNTYILKSDMVFKDLKYFNSFMNKDRADSLKPIIVEFSSAKFSVKNCASLMSNELLKGLGNDEPKPESNLSDDMDMGKFFKFKTTYHFPYKVKNYKSATGKGLLSEDKKSISFENSIDEFSDDKFSGDLDVEF